MTLRGTDPESYITKYSSMRRLRTQRHVSLARPRPLDTTLRPSPNVTAQTVTDCNRPDRHLQLPTATDVSKVKVVSRARPLPLDSGSVYCKVFFDHHTMSHEERR